MRFQADRRNTQNQNQQTPRHLIDTSARFLHTYLTFVLPIRVLGSLLLPLGCTAMRMFLLLDMQLLTPSQ